MKILALVLVGLLLFTVVGAQGKCTPEQREWIQNAGKDGLICEVYDHSWRMRTTQECNKEIEEYNKAMREGKKVLMPPTVPKPPGQERICKICGKKQHLEREEDGAAKWVDGWEDIMPKK